MATKSLVRDDKAMAKDIKISLKNLKTDYIDLYQCHNVKTDVGLEKVLGPNGALKALLRAKEAGKIRYIGISGHIVKTFLMQLKLVNLKQYNFQEILWRMRVKGTYFQKQGIRGWVLL